MKLKNISFLLLSFLLLFTACKEDETKVDNTLRVAFKEFNGSITDLSEVQQVNIVASKAAESEIVIQIDVLQDCGGDVSDYIFKAKDGSEITPSAEGKLTLSIPSGEKSTYFTVQSEKDEIPAGAEGMIFNLAEVENAALNDTHLNFELRIGTEAGFIGADYVQDFENCANSSTSADFYTYHAEGSKTDRSWGCRAVGNASTTAMVANAFGGDAGTVDAWLISTKKFDFTTATEKAITMEIQSSFSGNGELEVLWSEDFCGAGNPSVANWVNLSALESQFPAKGSKEYTTISTNLSQLLGKTFYLAFRFTGASADNSVSYEIDNLKLGKAEDGGDNGDGDGTSFSTKFEECTEDFSIPSGFIEEFLTAKTDRGWGCRSFGIDDSRAVQASAFGGDAGEDNAWLIIDQSFDFSELTSVNFLFSIYSNFSGPGEVIVQYSENYSGSGSPESVTWTAIDQINSKMPAAGSKEWVEINENVDELGGKTVYIAFQFVGANNEASSSWAIDDLAINDPDFSGGGDDNDGGSTDGITEFDTDFEGCTADFATPAGFIEVFETAKTDRGWGCRSFGLEDSRAVQASAFGGEEGEDNTWLIIEDKFDFTGLSNVNFLFSAYSNFDGPGEVIVQYSTNYSGSGSPSAASWTAISQINSKMPAPGSKEWVAINEDVAELGGKSVYIAFQFVGANNGASSSWAIDNLAINNPSAF
ncbi:choice-of-anchor J domain-containing protein [Marivirga sp. S37H4]|uniref:Choice-of-anchor J domain-containing protein n=1 Tax=Marivirga aurantiaca TaxID=2802615 RepID=A0A935C5X1_9BACT|nr:choice-of-anchor J domain-containing protein [Marivirga aurantiaca]MBK6264116.1 choice-of-anchor J domain-containing protein [Marivirga aurantiaca]